MKEETIRCPRCKVDLEIDSVREHKDGRKRVYWECAACGLSIMDRGKNTKT